MFNMQLEIHAAELWLWLNSLSRPATYGKICWLTERMRFSNADKRDEMSRLF